MKKFTVILLTLILLAGCRPADIIVVPSPLEAREGTPIRYLSLGEDIIIGTIHVIVNIWGTLVFTTVEVIVMELLGYMCSKIPCFKNNTNAIENA